LGKNLQLGAYKGDNPYLTGVTLAKEGDDSEVVVAGMLSMS